MLKAAIFDLDGTLLDSVEQHAQSWEAAFAKYGYRFPLGDIRKQIGKGGDKLLEAFLDPGQIQKDGKKIEEERAEYFKKNFLPSLRGFPEVPELLRALHERGLLVGLATSAKKDEVEKYEKILKIGDLVDATTTKDEVSNSKPDPDVLQVVRERLNGLKAEECIFVGDTAHDAEAAKRDGMEIVGVTCGGFTEEELREAGAKEVYRDPADLLHRWVPRLSAG